MRLLLEKKLAQYKPHPAFNWSIHLDGDPEMHDRSVCQKGVYDRAVDALKAAKAAGFRVNINCTLFDGADPARVAAFLDETNRLGVEGVTISPGYAYERAPDQKHFLNRTRTKQLFRDIFAKGKTAKGKGTRPGASINPRCSSISSPATRAIIARPGAIRRARSLVGSGPAISSAKAMPRRSKS